MTLKRNIFLNFSQGKHDVLTKQLKNTLETQSIMQTELRAKSVTSNFIAMMMELVHVYNTCVILKNTLEADRLQDMSI